MAKHMTMRFESGADRISALPDELLCHILSFLRTKKAVRTSVLSTRWRYLYNLLSSIDIDINLRDCHAESEKRCQFLNFMERYLLCHNRQSIQGFRLKWRYYIDPLQIKRWIGALVSRNIQELDLFDLFGRNRGKRDMQLPDSLFFCETLVALKLAVGLGSTSRGLKIPAKAFLPKLKALHIKGTSISSGQFTKLLSNCPVLEDLVLDTGYLRSDSFRLDISNAALKRLAICLNPWLPISLGCRDVQIVINSPTLEYLNYILYDQQSLKLLANQSLAKVVIGGYLTQKHNVLEGMNNIQSLEMYLCALEDLHSHRLHPTCFSKLIRLVISYLEYFTFHARCLEYVLAQCVVLEQLIFRDPWSGQRRGRTQFLLEPSRMTGMLSHLKRVEVKVMGIGDLEAEAGLIKLIEFFLNNANVLEELVVVVKRFQFPLTKSMHMMREMITTLPRVSERCIVSFKGRRR